MGGRSLSLCPRLVGFCVVSPLKNMKSASMTGNASQLQKRAAEGRLACLLWQRCSRQQFTVAVLLKVCPSAVAIILSGLPVPPVQPCTFVNTLNVPREPDAVE